MYKLRLYIFVALCVLAITVCIGRLAYLQIVCSEDIREQIRQERLLSPTQLPTIRGSILDRNNNVLALDKPAFYLQVNYQLIKFLDDRFWQANTFELISKGKNAEQAELELSEKFADESTRLWELIDKCSEFLSVSREEIENKIRNTNNRMWDLRTIIAWRRKFPNSEIIEKYRQKNRAVPISEALKDFEKLLPDNRQRFKLVMKVDIAEMHKTQPLIELTTAEQLLEAQLKFADTTDIEILPEAKRVYPYNSAACQLIGWVGTEADAQLFADDDYSRYMAGELSGKDGVERVCEVILRGRRGEITYNKDSELIDRKPTLFGEDVSLSLDIELQSQIETFLTDPNSNTAIGAVVIDVATGDILSLVSVPVYDLNTVRQNYNDILYAPGAPMMNKSIAEHYPPGSVIKPVILIAALAEGKISPAEVISCPFQSAPAGWPNCIMYRKFHSCHDWKWDNIARNAIRGSCNVYFSRLANRLDSATLQKWLFDFGYGRKILLAPAFEEKITSLNRTDGTNRSLQESTGYISTQIPKKTAKQLEDFPKIANYEKRMVGIGQGNLRATVLQVANAMAAIARGGIYKNPRLFLSESDIFNERQIPLGISSQTLAVIRDGMSAVVNETGGTAHEVFRNSSLRQRDIKIHGKTGSTEKPYNAWFAGFAEDSTGGAVSVAIVVEGGQSGAQDAAPLAEHIITLCNQAGFVGTNPAPEDSRVISAQDK